MTTALAILAGGEGSRMGRAKAGLTVGGKPILRFLLEQLTWSGDTLLVTAPGREHPPGAERFTRELIDPVPGLGPLRGIVTALESHVADRFVFVPVDMPGITHAQVAWLVELHDQKSGAGLMLRRERIEPMPAIIHGEALPLLRARLDAGQRSLYRLATDGVFHAVNAPSHWPASVWTNLNSPEDFRQFAGE